MKLLRRNLIKGKNKFSNVSIGSLKKMPERVLQFGEGNFLRAFVDWQFNLLTKAGLFDGCIVIVQPLERGMIEELNYQDGLYTVIQRGYEQGKLVKKMDVVTVVSRGINPYSDFNEFLNCAANPHLRYVISNTTESGIEYVKTENPTSQCPPSYPAKVAILLIKRFEKFKGDLSKGLIIIPCELIEQNGEMLKQHIIQHAKDWNCGDNFISWLEQSNYFCNTLVDRIVTGFPKTEVEELTQLIGYEDKLMATCEVFHKWVIHANPIVQKELPFDKIGLNVIWTDDIFSHRTLKVRILNGAHTTFTIPAFLAGKDFVNESLDDEVVGKFIRSSLMDEILPTIRFTQSEKEKFADAVIERFNNPFIKHELLSISLNSVSKFKVRVLPSLLGYQKLFNKIPFRLCLSLAALIRFYKPFEKKEYKFLGEYQGKKYQINDSPDVVNYFDEMWKQNGNDQDSLIKNILSQTQFWGKDISTVPGLLDTTLKYLQKIETDGMISTMKEIEFLHQIKETE